LFAAVNKFSRDRRDLFSHQIHDLILRYSPAWCCSVCKQNRAQSGAACIKCRPGGLSGGDSAFLLFLPARSGKAQAHHWRQSSFETYARLRRKSRHRPANRLRAKRCAILSVVLGPRGSCWPTVRVKSRTSNKLRKQYRLTTAPHLLSFCRRRRHAR